MFAGGIFTEGKLVLQTDPVQWVNQHSQIIKDLRVLDKETGSSNELGIYVIADGGVFNDRTVRFVDTFAQGNWPSSPRSC